MTVSQGQTYTILRNLGWRIRTTGEGTQCVRNFQRAYNLGTALVVDGVVGPKTSAALLRSYAAHCAGQPTASAHFSFTEFRCKCDGAYSSCQRIWVARSLLAALEAYRSHDGSVRITSGCRCVGHNRAVGGVRDSQHLRGTAADIHSQWTVGRVAGWTLFHGLGYARSSSHVRHVDMRTSATSRHPARWVYTKW